RRRASSSRRRAGRRVCPGRPECRRRRSTGTATRSDPPRSGARRRSDRRTRSTRAGSRDRPREPGRSCLPDMACSGCPPLRSPSRTVTLTVPSAARNSWSTQYRVLVRLGVLDVGSNTVHLLVVDAHRGGHPMPMSSTKATLRLSENMDDDGCLTESGARRLIDTVAEFASSAETSQCQELMPFATSALRDATNSEDVLERVREQTGVQLQILSGEDEARLTFLAVRRWYGWSAGRILNIDIGGGSLELTIGG